MTSNDHRALRRLVHLSQQAADGTPGASPNSEAERVDESTAGILLVHSDTPSPTSSSAGRMGGRRGPMRLLAKGASALCAFALLAAEAPAQDLLIFQGNAIKRVNVATGAITSSAINGLTNDHRLVGVQRSGYITNCGGTPCLASRIEAVTEDTASGLFEHHRINLTGSGATTSNSCLIDGGNWGPNGALVEYSRYLQDPSQGPGWGFTYMFTDADTLYGSPSCNSAPSGGNSLPLSLAPANGEFAGSMVRGDDLFVLRRSASALVLTQVNVNYGAYVPPPPPPWEIVQTWNVTGLSSTSQVLGMTIDCSGYLWAYVNQPTSCFPHPYGNLLLVRSTNTIASSSSLSLSTVHNLGAWNDTVCALPRAYLMFDAVAPSNLLLTGPTEVSACANVTLTATWDGGPDTGIVNPGNHTIARGGTISVQWGTHTLTVPGLSCINPTPVSHTVTRSPLTIGPTTSSDYTPCPESQVTLSAVVQNSVAPAEFRWRKIIGTSAGPPVAMGVLGPDNIVRGTFTVHSDADDGDYFLEVYDFCGEPEDPGYTSGTTVSIDVRNPPIVGPPQNPGSVCSPGSAVITFPVVSADPVTSWRVFYRTGTAPWAELPPGTGSLVGSSIVYTTWALTATTWFRITTENRCGESAPSPEAMIAVYEPPSSTTPLPLSVVLSPSTPCAIPGSSFHLSATGGSGSGWQWFEGTTVSDALSRPWISTEQQFDWPVPSSNRVYVVRRTNGPCDPSAVVSQSLQVNSWPSNDSPLAPDSLMPGQTLRFDTTCAQDDVLQGATLLRTLAYSYSAPPTACGLVQVSVSPASEKGVVVYLGPFGTTAPIASGVGSALFLGEAGQTYSIVVGDVGSASGVGFVTLIEEVGTPATATYVFTPPTATATGNGWTWRIASNQGGFPTADGFETLLTGEVQSAAAPPSGAPGLQVLQAFAASINAAAGACAPDDIHALTATIALAMSLSFDKRPLPTGWDIKLFIGPSPGLPTTEVLESGNPLPLVAPPLSIQREPLPGIDCNDNGFDDVIDLLTGTSLDLDNNGTPDECSTNTATPFCFGDGTGLFCPCGNNGAHGNGCANSLFVGGARLSAVGAARVATDSVQLQATGLSGGTAIFFQGGSDLPPFAVDDGLGCVGGPIIRLGTKAVTANSSSFPQPGDPLVSVRGQIPPAGGLRYYQCFYRNAAATFCPPATSNRTNGLIIDWRP